MKTPSPFLRVLSRLARRASAVAASAAFSIGTVAWAGGPAGSPPPSAATAPAASSDRFIVKFRDTTADPRARLAAVGNRSGRTFVYLRAMSGDAHVVRMTQAPGAGTDGATAAQASARAARQLMSDPDIAYIEPDARMVPLLVPNDPNYAGQYDLFDPVAGINMPAAWDLTTGSSSVVVAVIDTGIRPHIDLAGRTVPGYDFIADTTVSNDGDGRDADPSDPGDWCNVNSSSWHGTHVSGTIGAASNNGVGVTGINWVSKILPARVLGTCGGYTSDIADAMRWSAGIAVAGVPANANPARVENLSLGGPGTCSATFQSAINDAVARGTVVVVAAGNDNADVGTSQPANCAGVIAVAATTQTGARASFSNFGAGVTIAAPGTNILSTLNTGRTTPGADSYAYYSGTSMATPHVAGVVSLMLSQNPALTPAQVTTALRQSARSFPTGTGSDCSTAICGAGIVDAAAAIRAVTVVAARTNLALASNGTVASASTTHRSGLYGVAYVNDGDHRGLNNGTGGFWNDDTPNAYPDWVQLAFPSSTTVSEVDVYTVQDNYQNPIEPTSSTTFSQYGITDFDVQYWNGSTWVTVPGGSVNGSNLVWNKVAFAPVTTTAIRVQVRNALSTYSRIVEIEAYADAPRLNYASSANGGVVSASSTHRSGLYSASYAIDGDHRGLNSGTGGFWNDDTPGSYPDVLQVAFSATRSLTEIDVYTVQDNYQNPTEPTATTTFSQYGITDFDVQYWNGSTWVTVPNGSVSGNNLVWRKFTFPAVSTNAIRVSVRNSLATYSRIVEVEAYGDGATTTAPTTTNVASAANGGSVAASSTHRSGLYAASYANDGDHRGLNSGTGGFWNDDTANTYPDALQINFNATQSINEIDVYTVQDNYQNPAEPTSTMTFSLYGITDFDVQYWNGSTWVTVTNGSVSGNNLVWRKFSFATVSTNAIRVSVRNSLSTWSRIVEVEAYLTP